MLTADASEIAISAVLTQPDDEGHHHPVACESRKLTAAEQSYLMIIAVTALRVLELLAVVHAVLVFCHCLLSSNAPLPQGVLSDFRVTLLTDSHCQAVSWIRTKLDIRLFRSITRKCLIDCLICA